MARAGAIARERAHDRLAELSGRGLDLLATFWRESAEVIETVVPHYLAPCFFTLDPASLLATSHYQEGLPEIPAEWLAHEYFEDDVHKTGRCRAAQCVAARRSTKATYGDPSRSAAWNRYIQPDGGDQELIVACRSRAGEAWAMLSLYREPGAPLFDATETDFLIALRATDLAEGARRGLLIGAATDPEGPEAPGLVVLGPDWAVESFTPGVERLLCASPPVVAPTRPAPRPRSSPYGGQARRTADASTATGEVAVARVLSNDGRWMILHGAPLVAGGSRRVAVIVEPAHPARISALLMAAYGLTEREQDVTRLVLRGDSTGEIARDSRRLATHGATAPEAGVRKDRCAQPTRPGGQGLLRALRSRGSATTSAARSTVCRCAATRIRRSGRSACVHRCRRRSHARGANSTCCENVIQ